MFRPAPAPDLTPLGTRGPVQCYFARSLGVHIIEAPLSLADIVPPFAFRILKFQTGYGTEKTNAPMAIRISIPLPI